MNEKHYDLRFLPLFEDDLNEIVDYITYRLRNPAAAERLVDDVETAILERLPCAESFDLFTRHENVNIHIIASRCGTSPFSMW